MAIDPKTLTIGSHISVKGERERVRGMDEDNGLIIRFPAEYVLASEVEPIPLTPELLRDLGFYEVKDTYFSDWHNGWLKITNNTGQAKPWWTYNGFIKLYYLHQLEALYYLMYRQDLIKE